MAGQDRLQDRGAHFDRFLHHVVEAGVLERREGIGEVAQAILRPGLRQYAELIRAFTPLDGRLPFAVAPIEDQNRRAGRQPQHIAEIVALVALKRDRMAQTKRGVDKQPWRAKVECWHCKLGVFRFLVLFSPKALKLRPIIAARCGPARRSCQFHGLLRKGENRKRPHQKLRFHG